MRNFVVGLLCGILVAGGILWYFDFGRDAVVTKDVQERVSGQFDRAVDSSRDFIDTGSKVLEERMSELSLKADDIREEMAREGRILRQRAGEVGQTISQEFLDARTAAIIKAKLAADPDLSAIDIAVSVTEGRVVLSGTAASPDLIGRAIVLALDTGGVSEVISTIEVD